MKFHNLILLLNLSFLSTFCFSQNTDSVKFERKSANLKLSYNSALIHPGVRIGVELPLISTEINKMKRSGVEKIFIKERFVSANLSWYHHPGFHDNLYLTAGWTMRRTKFSGFLIEFSPEIGLSRTFLGETTYKVDNNGIVSIERLAGYYYGLISAGGGMGYDFSKTKSLPVMVFSKFNIITMFPYNSTIYLKPIVEIGLIYKSSNFLLTKIKSKRVKK